MNFYIMSKDIVVAKWQDDNLKIINEDLLPLFFQYSHDVFKRVIKSVGMHVKSNAITKFIMNSYTLIEK